MKNFLHTIAATLMISAALIPQISTAKSGVSRAEGIKKVEDHKKMCKTNPDGTCKKLGQYYARCSNKEYNRTHRLECNNKLIGCYNNPHAKGCFK